MPDRIKKTHNRIKIEKRRAAAGIFLFPLLFFFAFLRIKSIQKEERPG